MPTSKFFSRYPEFPSDVPVANIPTISFQRLQEVDNEHESESLFRACQEHGFFLLDLRESENGERLLEDAEMMLDLGATTLNLRKELLERYAYNPPRDLFGYSISTKFDLKKRV